MQGQCGEDTSWREVHIFLEGFLEIFGGLFWCRVNVGKKREIGNGKSCLQLTRLLPVNTRGKGVPKGRGL